MAWNYRKRIKILPGFYVNLSKSGMSATVGMRGLSLNISNNGAYINTGIPGTGLYNRQRLDTASNQDGRGEPAIPATIHDSGEFEIKSIGPEKLTSESMFGIKESILESMQEKESLYQEYLASKSTRNVALAKMILGYLFIFGLFNKRFAEAYRTSNADMAEVKATHEAYKFNIEFGLDGELGEAYEEMESAFSRMSSAAAIWDLLTEKAVDRVKERSSASLSITRTRIRFDSRSLEYIGSDRVPMRMKNANGADIYFYPAFIVMHSDKKNEFAVLGYSEIELHHHKTRFVETESIPSDSEIIDKTWRYVNKNGSPDRRYKDNPTIPIVQYYEFELRTSTGLHERYMLSNVESGVGFGAAFEKYRNALAKLSWNMESQSTGS